ncbi:MAG: hypothetical protein P8J32_07315 [bacterium]|nr:hypothetical protein [bacterium]
MSNHKFKTTNIRGKQYVEVKERVSFFRQEKEYKNWTISTDITILEDGAECLCKCIIADLQQRVVATGHAHEVKASSNINKTSYIENCETSAVGRALAMLAIGIDVSMASSNEVADAIAKQEADDAPRPWPKAKAKPAATTNDDYQKAVDYLKRSEDKADAWSKIEKQSKTKFTTEQYDRLLEYSKA